MSDEGVLRDIGIDGQARSASSKRGCLFFESAQARRSDPARPVHPSAQRTRFQLRGASAASATSAANRCWAARLGLPYARRFDRARSCASAPCPPRFACGSRSPPPRAGAPPAPDPETSPPTKPVRNKLSDGKAACPSSSTRSARTARHQPKSSTATCWRARQSLGRRGKIVPTAAARRHEHADRLEVAEGKTPPRNSLGTTSMLANVNRGDDLADRVRAALPARVSRTTWSSRRRRHRHDHRRPTSTAGRLNLRI